ncbi:O-antigen ligase family protein [Ruegeria faecimaris]|uniref:O-antigen ligase family protein n=1 Tax=Ruegeria faecimaris TaxID=686389 RepID=UPI0024917B1B|nr:O-antigen ligase family protein [Ruegeria faecimaris]
MRPASAQSVSFGKPTNGIGYLPSVDMAALYFLMAAVALAPMNYLRVDFVYFTLSDFFFVLAGFVMLAAGQLPVKIFGPASGFWYSSFLFFTGGLTIGSLIKGDPTELLTVFVQYFFSLIVLPILIGNRSFDQIVLLMKAFIIGMGIVVLFGIHAINFMEDPTHRFVSANGRMLSLVERANECALMLAMAIVFLLSLILQKQSSRIWGLIGLPILFYGVILTGSNSGLIVTIVGTVAIILSSGSPRHVVTLIVGTLIAVLVVLNFGELFLPEVFRERVLNAVLAGDISQAGTFSDRLFLLQEAFEVSRGTLLIGLGANQYSLTSEQGIVVHSAYLLTLSEGGLISLLGMVGFILASIYLAWMAISVGRSPSVGALTIVAMLMYVVLLAGATTFYARFWNVPFVLAIALSVSRLPVFGPTNTLRRMS